MNSALESCGWKATNMKKTAKPAKIVKWSLIFIEFLLDLLSAQTNKPEAGRSYINDL
jgi:hypothetical protein